MSVFQVWEDSNRVAECRSRYKAKRTPNALTELAASSRDRGSSKLKFRPHLRLAFIFTGRFAYHRGRMEENLFSVDDASLSSPDVSRPAKRKRVRQKASCLACQRRKGRCDLLDGDRCEGCISQFYSQSLVNSHRRTRKNGRRNVVRTTPVIGFS
jgi:hypothetical protein